MPLPDTLLVRDESPPEVAAAWNRIDVEVLAEGPQDTECLYPGFLIPLFGAGDVCRIG